PSWRRRQIVGELTSCDDWSASPTMLAAPPTWLISTIFPAPVTWSKTWTAMMEAQVGSRKVMTTSQFPTVRLLARISGSVHRAVLRADVAASRWVEGRDGRAEPGTRDR